MFYPHSHLAIAKVQRRAVTGHRPDGDGRQLREPIHRLGRRVGIGNAGDLLSGEQKHPPTWSFIALLNSVLVMPNPGVAFRAVAKSFNGGIL